MKWALTLHGGDHHGTTIVFEAETADEARRLAVQEMRRKDARVFELEKLE
ncbi:hypothetical protein CL1_1565 [Thermococcus cleftensis]|uniref:Uncharacterized protein n=1 Tax=Thermococcus cleftensis (strain DSM 27260 / KACC 17922 / CL1) TaxID=163003 RepID=I3ZVM8_THECF|nr:MULTISPECIES: hypothetical protein [Thermococcus]AFL95762.1 hypothetical protein CL1_1565 [Thermococcus cleftensis]